MTRALSSEEMVIAEDALITDVQFAIHNLLELKGVLRAELARRMGVSESHISQLFKDNSRNLTLKTIARIFRALDEEPHITSDLLDQLIPAAKRRVEAISARSSKQEDVIALILSETRFVEIGYRYECNDNNHEAELAA